MMVDLSLRVPLADDGLITPGMLLPTIPLDSFPPTPAYTMAVRFVISAVGIGMSKYALAGVEAGMLMDTRWAPQNAMQLMAHSDKVRHPLCRLSSLLMTCYRHGQVRLAGSSPVPDPLPLGPCCSLSA